MYISPSVDEKDGHDQSDDMGKSSLVPNEHAFTVPGHEDQYPESADTTPDKNGHMKKSDVLDDIITSVPLELHGEWVPLASY